MTARNKWAVFTSLMLWAVVLAVLLMISPRLHASTVPLTDCADALPDVSGSVSPSIACVVLPDAPPNLDGDFVSDGGTSFDFIEKDDGTFGGGTELVLSGDAQSGTWSITNFIEGMLYAVLFKDGSAEPSNQVAFIVDEASGTYVSPFFNTIDGIISKDISFTALFKVTPGDDCCGQIDVTPVPLPAGMLLLLTGFGGLAALRWRRSQSA